LDSMSRRTSGGWKYLSVEIEVGPALIDVALALVQVRPQFDWAVPVV
jgi:hypothetical protein